MKRCSVVSNHRFDFLPRSRSRGSISPERHSNAVCAQRLDCTRCSNSGTARMASSTSGRKYIFSQSMSRSNSVIVPAAVTQTFRATMLCVGAWLPRINLTRSVTSGVTDGYGTAVHHSRSTAPLPPSVGRSRSIARRCRSSRQASRYATPRNATWRCIGSGVKSYCRRQLHLITAAQM